MLVIRILLIKLIHSLLISLGLSIWSLLGNKSVNFWNNPKCLKEKSISNLMKLPKKKKEELKEKRLLNGCRLMNKLPMLWIF